ncbi:transmembrane protein 223 isoform X1 [Osmia lignaria lignaria]|uniref:transmembrane protein 223 isoform X1 n=2 Tax=Osmia lignaria lignaria TaxID=1437193 RepID=UPI0014791B06|nr:transmembrane protein 223 isoform X1 [Osmia lignaria]
MFSSLCCRGTTNYANKLYPFYKLLANNAIHKNFVRSKYTFKVKNIREYSQNVKSNSLYVNTNIQNNVLLYKYVNVRYFILFKVFCFGWILFASIISYYTYDSKFVSTFSKNISWMDYIKENGTKLLYFVYALIIGPSAFWLLYTAHKKFIKYIILHKGGKDVSIITHHLFKSQDVAKFPIEEVTAITSRNKMKDYLPIKVKGRWLYYLLDADGKFLNPELFDHTIGMQKRW